MESDAHCRPVTSSAVAITAPMKSNGVFASGANSLDTLIAQVQASMATTGSEVAAATMAAVAAGREKTCIALAADHKLSN